MDNFILVNNGTTWIRKSDINKIKDLSISDGSTLYTFFKDDIELGHVESKNTNFLDSEFPDMIFGPVVNIHYGTLKMGWFKPINGKYVFDSNKENPDYLYIVAMRHELRQYGYGGMFYLENGQIDMLGNSNFIRREYDGAVFTASKLYKHQQNLLDELNGKNVPE